MYRIETSIAASLNFKFEDKSIQTREGDTVASALLANEITSLRTTPVTGSPRGAFCMMGVCFDCLVEINGASNQQACMTKVQEGMQVKRQHGAGQADIDLTPKSGGEVSS